MFVLMVSQVFAGTERVITNKNEYEGKTVEVIENLAGLHKVVTHYDKHGKRVKRDLFFDGENIWRAHKVTVYYDVNEVKLFEEHFDKKGEPVQDAMGWRYFGSTDNGDFYYRVKDITKLPGDKVTVYCKVKFSKTMIRELAAEYSRKVNDLSYAYGVYLYEIHSTTKKWAGRSSALYDKTDRLIDTETLREEELEWNPIPQGAPLDILYNIVHNRKR